MREPDARPVRMESAHHHETPRPAAVGVNPACPWLPEIAQIHDFTLTRRHGRERGSAFYQDALRYGQSLWMSGKPAQALLQLDKAWMADLPAGDPVLADDPSPYQALVWIIERAAFDDCGYLGNPVRHFQHLASRMSGDRAEIRSWRAWLCFHLSEHMLPRAKFPRDGYQISREGLWIPGLACSLAAVAKLGWPGETEIARHCLQTSQAQNRKIPLGFPQPSRHDGV